LNLQSLNGNLNIKGGTTVVIGPTSIINAGTVPSAGAAGAADNAQDSVPIAEQALPAVIADTPTTYNRVENSPDSSGTGGSGGPGGAGGGGSQSVISTITSETPGPEPDTTRFMNSPGYSGTNTVEIAEDVAEGINTGQILKNQSTPLQTLGFVGSGATIGEGGGATNDKGFNPLIYEAIQAIKTTYPRATISSGVRTSDGASVGEGNGPGTSDDGAGTAQGDQARIRGRRTAVHQRAAAGHTRAVQGQRLGRAQSESIQIQRRATGHRGACTCGAQGRIGRPTRCAQHQYAGTDGGQACVGAGP
jgi:hypothetical protein